MALRFNVAEAVFSLGVDRAGLTRGLKEAEGEARRGGGAIARTLQAALSPRVLFAGLLTGAGAVFGQLAAIGISHLRDLDQAQARFRAETGASAAEARQMGIIVRQAFRRNLDSVEALAGAAVALRREMGLTTAQVGQHLQTFLEFAKVTGQDVAQAIRALDDIMDAWGLTIEQAAALMDRLKRTSELTGANVIEMQGVLAAGTGTFQALGLSVEDVIALMGLMAERGIQPEKTLRALTQAASKGFSPEQFNLVLRKLGEISDEGTRAQAAMELFGARGGAELARLITPAGFALDELTAKLRASGGAAHQAFVELQKGPEERIGLFKKGLISFAAVITGPVLGAFASLFPVLFSVNLLFPTVGAAIGAAAATAVRAVPGFLSLAGALGVLRGALTLLVAHPWVIAISVIGATIVGINRAAGAADDLKRSLEGLRDEGKITEEQYNRLGLAFLRGSEQTRQAVIAFVRARQQAAQPVQAPALGLEAAPGAKPKGVDPQLKAFLAFLKKQQAETKGLKGAAAGVNEELQRALQIHELVNIITGRGAAAQIADLERIRALYTKTTQERLQLTTLIAQKERDLRQQVFQNALEGVEDSRRFIREELVGRNASFTEILAAYERTFAKIRAIRTTDADQAREKARLLKDLAIELRDFEVTATREAAERIKALRRTLADEMDALAGNEFEVRRAAIVREYEERLRALGAIRILEARDARDREAIIAAKNAAILRLTQDNAIAVADAEAQIVGVVLQRQIDKRRELLALLTKGTPEYLRVLAEIEDLERRRAQQIVEQTDAMVELGLATRQQALDARVAYLGTLIPNSAEYLRLLKEIRDEQMLLSRDPFVGMRAAIEDITRRVFDWREAWRGVLDDVGRLAADAFDQVFFEGANAWEKLVGLVRDLWRSTMRTLLEGALQPILQQALGQLLPLLPQAAPIAAAAPILTAAVAGGGATAASAMSLAIAGAGEGVAALIAAQFIAAGEVVATSIAAALAGFSLFGLARGGFIAAQQGLLTRGLVPAVLHPNELVLPLPRGLRPENLAHAVARTSDRAVGDVHITYTGDMSFREAGDLRAHARLVADALRLALRGNHPFGREGR